MTITAWVLLVCTPGWGMCGTIYEHRYETEKQCYTALESVYKHTERDSIKYAVCQPVKQKEVE